MLWDILERNGRWEPPTDHSPFYPTEREGKEVVSYLHLHILVFFSSMFLFSPLSLSFLLCVVSSHPFWEEQKKTDTYRCPAMCHHLASLRVRKRVGHKEPSSCVYLSTAWQSQCLHWKPKPHDLCILSSSQIFVLRNYARENIFSQPLPSVNQETKQSYPISFSFLNNPVR